MSNHKKENNINLMNQVFINSLINETPVNEEEKEEVSGVKAIKALLPPDVKKVEPGTKKEISRIDIPVTTVSEVSVVPDEVVEDNIPSTIGPLSVDDPNYEDPTKSKFYLQGEEVVKKINQLQENPIINSLGEINVDATMNKVDNIITDSPSLIKSKDEGVELVSDILTYDQAIKIKTFNEEGIFGLIDPDDDKWIGNEAALEQAINSLLPPDITQDQIDLYTDVYEGNFNNKKDVENINKKTRGSIKVPSEDFTQYYDVYDIKQLDARFEVDEYQKYHTY